MYLFLIFGLIVLCSCECFPDKIHLETLGFNDVKEVAFDLNCAIFTSLNKTKFRLEFYYANGQMAAHRMLVRHTY